MEARQECGQKRKEKMGSLWGGRGEPDPPTAPWGLNQPLPRPPLIVTATARLSPHCGPGSMTNLSSALSPGAERAGLPASRGRASRISQARGSVSPSLFSFPKDPAPA